MHQNNALSGFLLNPSPIVLSGASVDMPLPEDEEEEKFVAMPLAGEEGGEGMSADAMSSHKEEFVQDDIESSISSCRQTIS